MELSPEEKQRIYEEEKARDNARQKIKAKRTAKGCGCLLLIFIVIAIGVFT